MALSFPKKEVKGLTFPVRKVPVAPVKDQNKYESYFKGGNLGVSNIKDASGRPLLTYKDYANKKSVLDTSRVATTFDPRAAQVVNKTQVSTPRDEKGTSAIRKERGATDIQQLDHIVPVSQAGSNNPKNLNLVTNVDNIKTSDGGKQPLYDLENSLAKKIKAGGISVFEAQKQLNAAKTKEYGTPTTQVPNKSTIGEPRAALGGKAATPELAASMNKPSGGKSTMPNAIKPLENPYKEMAKSIYDTAKSVQGKGINNLANKVADELGFQSVIHPVETFKGLAKEIGEQSDSGVQRITSSIAQIDQNIKDKNAGHPVPKTRVIADMVNLLHGVASLAMLPISAPFSIGSKLPVFKPAFDAIGVIFDQTGKIAAYDADKTLNIIPDSVLSQEQKRTLTQPVRDVATLAGQIVLGGKILHEVSSLTDAKGKVSDADVAKLTEQYTQEAKDLSNKKIVEAVQSGDVQKINSALKEATEPKAKPKPTAEDFISKKDAKLRVADDLNNENLTTKILDKLKGKTVVSRQFIEDLTNSPDLKQAERDLIRSKLAETTGDKIDVQKFADEVKAELLPLKVKNRILDNSDTKYEHINLPDELRGPVANYTERIYESPIKTSAGGVHFSESRHPGYFGHTRIEDLPAEGAKRYLGDIAAGRKNYVRGTEGNEVGTTRRVLELQSDLYQKGRLEDSTKIEGKYFDEADKIAHQKEVAKLDPYQNNAAHFRMIREEVAQAAKDGKTKLQFPTGETAMKIEGLGTNTDHWINVAKSDGGRDYVAGKLTVDDLKPGLEVKNLGTGNWIITDVIGDGKFKAVSESEMTSVVARFLDDLPKKVGDMTGREALEFLDSTPKHKKLADYIRNRVTEEFDISGKVDTSNPIYKFYEKDVGRYLKNKYDAKLVTDKQGVSWWEADIKPEHKGAVEAFRLKDDLAAKGIDITDAQEKEIIALNEKLFGDADVKVMGQILANKEALGKYQEGIIEILKGQANAKATFYHEAVHKYLDVFLDKTEHAEILKEGAKKYGLDDFAAVEERIAEDFIKYAEDRSGATGKIKTYFDKLITRIQEYLGNEVKIDKLYQDIISGKAKEKAVKAEAKADVPPKPRDEFQSRAFERMQEEFPDLVGDATQNRASVDAALDKGMKLLEDNKQEAYETAMGRRDVSDTEKVAANIVLSKKALEEGNWELASKTILQRSLAQTERGRAINLEKASVTDNTAERYVKDLIASRIDALGDRYTADVKEKLGGKKKSKAARGADILDKETEKFESRLKEKKMTVKDALGILEELTCV